MASDSGSLSSILGEAAQAFKAQDFGRACELFHGVVEAEPGNAKAWFFLGQALIKQGQPREALAAFKQAAEGTDPRVAGLARQAAESLARQAPPAPVVEEPVEAAPEPVEEQPEAVEEQAEPEPEGDVEEPVEPWPESRNPRRETVKPCPRCGLPIPRELWDTPRCPCGYGQLESRTGPVDRIYLSTLLAYQRAARGAIELNIRNDHYTLAGKLKVKQLSARATEIDPRMVFPTDRGLPYLRREDLGVVKNDQNKDANFALGFGGFYTWDEGLAEFERVLGPEGLRPAGGLGTLLLDYGGMEEADVATAEGQVGDGTLGEVLVWGWGSPLEDVITSALGARIATPVHQGANALGHQLLAQGAITPEQLTKAVMTQLTARKPLLELLGGDRLPADQVQAAQEAIAAAGWPLPARDEVGELLYRRGLLGRTDLAQAHRDAQEKGIDPVAALAGKGRVDARALDQARQRAAMKLHLRKEGMIRLGEVLVKQQACSAAAVAEALQAQVHDPRPLGALIVALGHCTPEQVVYALDEQEAALDALADKIMADRERKAAAARPAAAAAAPRELTRLEKILALVQQHRRLAVAAAALLIVLPVGGVALQRHMQAADHQREVLGALDALLVAPAPTLAKDPVGVPKELTAKLNALYMKPGPSLPIGDLAAARRKAPQAFDGAVAAIAKPGPPDGTGPMPVDDDRLVDALLPLAPEPTEGERLLAEGRLQEALTALGGDAGPRAALARAKAYRLLGSAPKALSEAQAALKAAPGDREALLAVARAYLLAHQAGPAVEAFAKLPAADPAGRLGRAAALLEGGQEPEARAALQEVLAVDASNGTALIQLAQLDLAKDPAASVERLVLAAGVLSKEVEAGQFRLQAAREKGNLLAWIVEAQAGIASGARLAGAYTALDQALAASDPARAEACATRATATYRGASRGLLALGDAYAAAKATPQAVQAWTTAARLAPFNPVPVARLAMLARLAGQPDATAKLADLAVKRAPR